MTRHFIFSAAAILSIALFPCSAPALNVVNEARIDDLISRMTLEEKVGMVSGQGVENHGVDRLKIPSLKMTDGPSGSRWVRSTAFPAGILLGATFNPELVRQVGAGIGLEAKAEGRDMLLGPTMNILRMPLNGRAFETFGEDPYLTSMMSKGYIAGVQS